MRQHRTAVDAAAAAGVQRIVSGKTVPRLTGHPARTVAEHLRAHPED